MEKSILYEEDAKNMASLSWTLREKALAEISEEEYSAHVRPLFGREVLDYAKTLVINLPGSCFANCPYCIDKELRANTIEGTSFIKVCKSVLTEKSDFKEISVTGGSLPPDQFNLLMEILKQYCPKARITWNTNGAYIDDRYDVSSICYINLHRNAVDDKENRELFRSSAHFISIEDGKRLFGDRLCLRVTIDDTFDIDGYASFQIPLYLNRLLPGNAKSEQAFREMENLIKMTDTDVRRRNTYINGMYNGIPIRICTGDKLAEHIPGRYPMWVNVVIIHRDGTVCGSWYRDDKVLFKYD